MDGATVVSGVAGGLGLFLLGLWLATEGLKVAAGGILRANLGEWTAGRWRSFETGFAISILLPSWGGLTRAAIGLVNSAEVSLRNALWVVVGCAFGAVMTAWVVVGVGFSPFLPVVALTILMAGLLLRWIGSGERREAWGMVLIGTGVLFLGLRILASTAGSLPARVDDFALDPLWQVLGGVALGAVVTAAVTSTSAVVILVFVAAAAGAIDVTSAAALLVGANLGAVAAAARTLLDGSCDARRVAVGITFFHVVGSTFGLLVLLLTLPSGRVHGGFAGGSLLLLAGFQTIFSVVGAVLLRLMDERLIRWLLPRFNRQGDDGAASQRLDVTAISVPVLALEAVAAELKRLGIMTLRLTQRIFDARPPTEARTQQDAALILGLAEELDAYTVRLFRAPLPRRIADTLLEVTRAVHAYRTVATGLPGVRDRIVTSGQGIDPAWMNRIRQYQHPVLHFLSTCNAFQAGFDLETCRQGLGEAQEHVRSLVRRLLAQGAPTAAGAEVLNAALERLEFLDNAARQLTEAAAIVDRAGGLAIDDLGLRVLDGPPAAVLAGGLAAASRA